MNFILVPVDEVCENSEKFLGKLFKFLIRGKICYLLDIFELTGDNNGKYYYIQFLSKTRIDYFTISKFGKLYFLED